MTALRKVLPAVLIAVPWTASTTVPMAAADPQQFPDLSGYNDVNSPDYRTYSAYSTIGA